MRVLRVSVLLSLLTPCVLGAEAWTLTGIVAKGSTEFPSEEIVLATGLKLGSTVGAADFKSASERLARSGAFDKVSHGYSVLAGKVTVTFEVIDAERYLPIRFENFVWAEDVELRDDLSRRVPFFHGRVSPTGEMVQSVETALTEWLHSRGLPGVAASSLHATPEGRAVDAVSFEVKGVPMPVKKIDLENAPSLDESEREELSRLLVGSDYQRSTVLESARLALGRAYARKGMLKADFTGPRVRLLGSDPAACELGVTFLIREGPRYRVSGVEWKNPPSDDLARQIHVAPGSIANPQLVDKELDDVKKQLARKGYLQARATAAPRYHDEDGTVAWVIDVQPGVLFRMGAVEFIGIPDALRARMLESWRLKPGEPFDADYASGFIRDNAATLLNRGVTLRTKIVEENTVNVRIEITSR